MNFKENDVTMNSVNNTGIYIAVYGILMFKSKENQRYKYWFRRFAEYTEFNSCAHNNIYFEIVCMMLVCMQNWQYKTYSSNRQLILIKICCSAYIVIIIIKQFFLTKTFILHAIIINYKIKRKNSCLQATYFPTSQIHN